MDEFDEVDFFTDPALIPSPYEYFDQLRSKCPVLTNEQYGLVAITGHDEAVAVYKDSAYSSCVTVAGPYSGVSFDPTDDDIGALIEECRDRIPMSEHIVTQDPPHHTRTRGLLSRLLTPRRLQENEEFMWRLADRQLAEFVAEGSCEFMAAYAKPFSMLVIADLLGVPESDHDAFRESQYGVIAGNLGKDQMAHNPLLWLEAKFTEYVTDRRSEPREDVLTALALAKYPDGGTPEVVDVVRLATFLFAAGQDTTTKLLSAGIRMIAEQPELQQQLRDDRDIIPGFLEEVLRLESPVKSHFRLSSRPTSIGEMPIPAGTTVMLLPGASNRDPRKFPEPNELRVDRRNVREHVAFGRGIHSCPGAPLARAEGRISMNRILDRMGTITIDERQHGPAGERRYSYDPTFIMRGLSELHIEFNP
ncbi:cytochrome P450 [Aldersonia sp. NBC_00410]|uniref:cytochrome P450 n=1 Tax=Aldersonia sp. NBC_00410 TaxID=2975954 RepID=UPI00224DCF89|nr:cytochrome P450 [Aldersonia sp. NBC_00410]MCX5044312.1 cytochrome P450 [Aldersonia sp. NBC_00410]